MFKKIEEIRQRKDDTTLASTDSQRKFLEKITTDSSQYDLTDMGATVNPFRFLSLRSTYKGLNEKLTSNQRKFLEKITTDSSQYDLTDMGVVINPHRFLSRKDILKKLDEKLETISEELPENKSYGL